MEFVHGLVSCDSHAQPPKDTFTERMSKRKWGDAIPQVRLTDDPAHMVIPMDGSVERWFVHGAIDGLRGVSNCPTVMGDATRKTFPQHWDEVPPIVYDPEQRLTALDRDGIDAEVLFPNDPVQGGTFFQGDATFELACVQAYNDWLATWQERSPRFVPLAIIPYLSDVDVTIAEVTRIMGLGYKGINMLTEPSQSKAGLKHFNDPYWYPLWAACEEMGTLIHWHATGGLKISAGSWNGYTQNQKQAVQPSSAFAAQAQFIPNLIFSGVLDRYPTLKWVCAETGVGWVNYVLEACDHEWERRHLWTEGITTRPSDLFRRQIYVDFWYEKVGVQLRNEIGIDNIMWESDYPHSTSTFPESRRFVDRTLDGLPQEDRDKLAYGNAARLYGL